ncbi:MAG: uridylate kinase [Chloroflexi bacterium]|jgi:uridylate kinase|nr:MAG: uridylate kinase [Chloroflexota bacterium]
MDPDTLRDIAKQVGRLRAQGVEVALVIGGGNLFRGRTAAEAGMDRATADYAGMLATVINGLALQDALEREGLEVRTMSAVALAEVAEPYIRRRAIRHLEKGRVVLFVAGTGNPYVTTDTAAALRGVEIDAARLLMAKNGVNGVYTADPALDPQAKRYATISYRDAIAQNLGVVMDTAALSLCEENDLPILVFDIAPADAIVQAVMGGSVGTLVGPEATRLAGAAE